MTVTSPKGKTFLDLLKKQCQKCTKGTVKTYLQNIRRLYRLEFEGDVPLTGKWLDSDKLFAKYKKQDLKVRRHLSTGAIKALASYGKDTKKWYKNFIDDQNDYAEKRLKHEKSDTEKKNWTSIKELKKATKQLKQRIKHILEATPTLSNLYKIQFWLVLKMYTEVPVRNDMPTVELKKNEKGNYVKMPPKGNFTLVFQNFKNSDKLGPREIKLSRALSMAIRRFLKYRNKVKLDHDFLLTGKSGKPMSRGAFGKAFRNQTEELMGKRVGSRIIRVVVSTENRKILEKAAEISNKLLHTQKRTLDYIRKDD